MTNYAEFSRITLHLSNPTEAAKAIEHFGIPMDVYHEILGTYVRGPKRGKCKGYITYDVCTKGGWVHDSWDGHVARPGDRQNMNLNSYDVLVSGLKVAEALESEQQCRENPEANDYLPYVCFWRETDETRETNKRYWELKRGLGF